jgi:hypothetical protein
MSAATTHPVIAALDYHLCRTRQRWWLQKTNPKFPRAENPKSNIRANPKSNIRNPKSK